MASIFAFFSTALVTALGFAFGIAELIDTWIENRYERKRFFRQLETGTRKEQSWHIHMC